MNGKHKLESDAEDVDKKKGKIDNVHSDDFQDASAERKASSCNLKVYPKRNRTPSAKAFDCLVESTDKQKNLKPSKKSNTSPRKTPSKLYFTDASSKQISSSEKITNDGMSIDNSQSTSVTLSDLTSSSVKNDVCRDLINASGKLPLVVLQNIEIQREQVGTKEKDSDVKVVENSYVNPLDDSEKNILDVENQESSGRLPSLNAGGKTDIQMKPKAKIAERCNFENLPLLESTKKTELQLMQNKTCESILLTHIRDGNDMSNLGSKNLPLLDAANDRFIQNSPEKLPCLKPIVDAKNVMIVQLNPVTSEKLPVLDLTEKDENKLKLSTGSDDLRVDKKEKAGHTNFLDSIGESSLQESRTGTKDQLSTPSEKLPPLTGTVKDAEIPSKLHTADTENKIDLKCIRTTENLSTSAHSDNTDEPNISKLHSNGMKVKELPSLNPNILREEEQLNLQNKLKVLPPLDHQKDLVEDGTDFTETEKLTSSNCTNIIDDKQLNSGIIDPSSRELGDFVDDKTSVVVSCSTVEDVLCGSSKSIENEPFLDSKFKTETVSPITGSELSKLEAQTVSSTTNHDAISDKINVSLDAVTETLPELDFNLITDGLPLMNSSDSTECLPSVEY